MDPEIKKKYNYWQWRTLIILMIGYALFYFVRKNFSIIMPAMEAELGVSKVQLGLFLTLHGIIYGCSRFINGFLADRVSRKRMMALGLFLSALVNILIGLSPAMDGLFNFLDAEVKATAGMIAFIGSLWLINGYTQGMGYPPCGSLMALWIKPSELATKQSIWNSSHSIGASLVAFLCGSLILGQFSYAAWQWCFFIPALLAMAGTVMLLVGLKDKPSSVGLPDPETLDEDIPHEEAVKEEPEKFTHMAYKRLLKDMVFKNPVLWIICVSNFCVYVLRFTILDWGATFLTQDRGMSIGTASTVVALSEVTGGIIGTLLAGWFTDKFFKSRAHRTCMIGMAGATLCFFVYWLTPKGAGWHWLAVISILMSSFFVYMPQALNGIACSNQATKRVAASANGIAGILGYASTTISGLMFGALAHKYGWNSVFEVAIAFGIVGTALYAVIWKAPADGYEKANKILAEVREEYEKSA